ncbi:hypothetical protein DV515_00013583 [Chloebia gouldiae]|uniref:Uncharacterized protein n=1 Tax=Chloebia gouldiae TaxID=44316 RepID=A0A3L8S0F5_CHLGU|nr:hypothetical protein DV515_00013583 [Chloebia gouldiae]
MEGKAPALGRAPAPSKSRRKNASVKKGRTEQSPQRPICKGQLHPQQPSASASPRKHGGGLPGYTPGVKGVEWREPGRQRGREENREQATRLQGRAGHGTGFDLLQARGNSEPWICQHQLLPTGTPEDRAGVPEVAQSPGTQGKFSWLPL